MRLGLFLWVLLLEKGRSRINPERPKGVEGSGGDSLRLTAG
jgi:hypothetical protein